MEICNVDQMGCEDPDLEIDTTAHALSSLEQELRLMVKSADQKPSCMQSHIHDIAICDQYIILQIMIIENNTVSV